MSHDFGMSMDNCWVCGGPIYRDKGTRVERDGHTRAIFRHAWNSDLHYGHPAEHVYRLIHEELDPTDLM